MGNKYDGNGEVKADKVLMGLVMQDGKLVITMDKEAPMPELVRFWGILSIEMPMMLLQIKHAKAQQESSGLVVPNRG